MLYKLRHLWDKPPYRCVGPEGVGRYFRAYLEAQYRQGRRDARWTPYYFDGRPWCWIRRLLRLLGRDPNERYGWFQTRKDVPDA